MPEAIRCDFTLPRGAEEQLGIYLEMLEKWNGRFNLTSFDKGRLREEVVSGSLIFADTIAALLPGQKPLALCDIGSGAGIPGMVLKMAMPEAQVDLVESNGKKARFLREVKTVLGLEGLNVVNKDAKEFARSEKNLYNAVTGRAFGKKFLKHAFRLVLPGAYVMYHRKAFKKGEFAKEPDLIRDYGGAFVLIWKNG
jgi:16S rRNA (guanine527-N7)-methyltransferase